MSRLPRRDTGPELAVRRLLHAAGYRYRVCFPVPGAPRRSIDIAFTKSKVAVFIDGCFWHGCPDHGGVPRANNAWWATKLANNAARDRVTDEQLIAHGWTVLRFWEHTPAEEVVGATLETLRNRRASLEAPLGVRPLYSSRTTPRRTSTSESAAPPPQDCGSTSQSTVRDDYGSISVRFEPVD